MRTIEDKLYTNWERRNPHFEIGYEDSVIRIISDYGVGASSLTDAKGKILGAGYEVFILAFFLGLYSDKKVELSGETKSFGQPIQYWGNIDNKIRTSYSKLRTYIFIALVAKTDFDFIELDKGKLTLRKAVDNLIELMDQYANYGFTLLEDKLKNNPSYFYGKMSFLNMIFEAIPEDVSEDAPEEMLEND